MRRPCSRWTLTNELFSLCTLVITTLLVSPTFGDLEDVERAEAIARNAMIQEFVKFTSDKNVMGKAQSPDGKAQQSGKKQRFDNDGGGLLPFQSDLTYHAFAFNSKDPNQKNNPKAPRLFAFVSGHGGIGAAGGSSILERTEYNLHKQFSKEDEATAKKNDEKNGIKFRSIYKVETREVVKNNKDGGNEEPEKVERVTLRDEAKNATIQVGEDSFETVRKAGRDKGFEDDGKTLANGVFLRFAAGQATQAMWMNSQRLLGQRRANRAVRPGAFPESPQLSEGVYDCDQWANNARQALNAVKNPQEAQALQQEIQRMQQQCAQVTQLDYKVINPKFAANKNGKGEQLTFKGPAREDAFERDERNQMEVLSKASTKVGDLITNFEYGQDAAKTRVTIDFDDDGNPLGEIDTNPVQQIDGYNKQLAAAGEGYDEVRSRYPDLQAPDPNQFAMDPNRSILDVNSQPVVSAYEEVGINQVAAPPPPPQTYDDLLQRR